MPLRLPARRLNKYHAVATRIDGVRFDSKKEARRYAELTLLEKAGLIHELQLQPVFPLLTAHHKGGDVHQVGTYKADFSYRDSTGRVIVEDVKSSATRTALYRLKKRMTEAAYGITIRET